MARFIRKFFYWFFIGIFFIIQIYPIFWLVAASFRTQADLSLNPFGIPKSITLVNYISVITKSNVFLYMKNSAIVTAVSLLFILFLSSMASFAISKMRFALSRRVFDYFLLGLTIPTFITIIPLYLIYARLHLIDSYLGLILPQVAFALPFSVLLFVNFFKYISNEILEAAFIDGCSIYRVYLSIIFPLSRNTVLTVLSMCFINVWNDYLFSLIFINSTWMKTATVGLQDFIGQHGATDWGATFASICVTTLPTLIIYFALNKRVSNGMTLGAVKE